MDHRSAPRNAPVVVFVVLGMIVSGVIGYLIPRPQPDTPIVVSTPPPTPTPYPTPTPAPVRVYVSGAVRQSAVYELPRGSLVQDAINAASGPTSDADLDRINLALELQDQQQVYVPYKGEAEPLPPVSGGETDRGASGDAMININTATEAELEALPRIGPVTAHSIVEYRETNGAFSAIEDIQNVTGIGPATFEGLRDLIAVGP